MVINFHINPNIYLNLKDIVDCIIEYQRKNFITGECITNSIILYDIIKNSTGLPKCNVEVINGFMVLENKFVSNHSWVEIDGFIYDLNLGVRFVKDIKYFKSFNDVKKYTPFEYHIVSHKELLNKFFEFKKIIKTIIESKKGQSKYLDDVLDYLEEKLKCKTNRKRSD